METGLLRDRDWAPLDGALCRVTTLTPLGFTKGMPYASVEVESTLLAEPTTAFVTHKLDFVIMWTKRHLKRRAKLVSRFMPRMWVSLCRANTFELLTDQPWEEPQGPERDVLCDRGVEAGRHGVTSFACRAALAVDRGARERLAQEGL